MRASAACASARVKTTGSFAGRVTRWTLSMKSSFRSSNPLIKKQHRTESLILSRCGDALLDSEMSEKFGDFFLAHFVWMAFAMKKNESLYPINVSLLCADGVMFHA